MGRLRAMSSRLRTYRPHAIFGACATAAVLTPPDPLSMFAVALPAVLLYEGLVFVVTKLANR